MTKWLVSFPISVEAESPEEAAEKASQLVQLLREQHKWVAVVTKEQRFSWLISPKQHILLHNV